MRDTFHLLSKRRRWLEGGKGVGGAERLNLLSCILPGLHCFCRRVSGTSAAGKRCQAPPPPSVFNGGSRRRGRSDVTQEGAGVGGTHQTAFPQDGWRGGRCEEVERNQKNKTNGLQAELQLSGSSWAGVGWGSINKIKGNNHHDGGGPGFPCLFFCFLQPGGVGRW